MKLFCGKDYPDNPPAVRFQSRINMTCVNPETGVVWTISLGIYSHFVNGNNVCLVILPGWKEHSSHACQMAKGIYNGGHIDTTEERNDVIT